MIARANLVSYYDELSREADKRRARAEWRAKRLELGGARLRLLQQEAEMWRAEEGSRWGEGGGGEVDGPQLVWSGVRDDGASGEGERDDIVGTGGEMLDGVAENTGEDSVAVRAQSPGRGTAGSGRRGRQTWAESMVGEGGAGQEGRRTWLASLVEPGISLAAGEDRTAPSESPEGQPSAPEEGLGREERLVEEDTRREDATATTGSCHPTQDRTGPHSVPVVEGGDARGKDAPDETSPHSMTAETQSQITAAGKESTAAEGVSSDRLRSSPQPSPVEYRPHRKAVPGGDIHYSVIQEALYGRAGWAGSREEFSRCVSPRLVSSRGQSPPSVAQDIMYGRKPPGSKPGFSEPRQSDGLCGREPQDIAERVSYKHSLQTSEEKAGSEGLPPPTHGRAPPSVIQDILYPGDGGTSAAVQRSEDSLTPRLKSSRGQAPPSTAQTLMYPGHHNRGQCHAHLHSPISYTEPNNSY